MSQCKSRPRVAIIGAGMIAEAHRRAALLAGARIVGVLASTPQRSLDVAADWGVDAGYASINDLAEAAVDVVHVASPNNTHYPYVSTLINSGKQVICEKPLGLNADQAARMALLAEESGRLHTVPFVYRYHPLVREIRHRAQCGEFGRWHLLHGSYLQDWLLAPDASNWRVDPASGGQSRAFADIGSHWCDLVEWVSGERLASVCASISTVVPGRPTEDSAMVLIRTESGVAGSVVVSQVSAGRHNRLWFELDGEYGSAVFDQENPEQIWLGKDCGAQLVARTPNLGSPEQRRLSVLPAGHPQGFAQCFEAFVADSYAAWSGDLCEERRAGLPTFADGLRAARIVDAVLRSAATSSWVDLS